MDGGESSGVIGYKTIGLKISAGHNRHGGIDDMTVRNGFGDDETRANCLQDVDRYMKNVL